MTEASTRGLHKLKDGATNVVNVHLRVNNPDAIITLDTDESYALSISSDHVMY